MVLFICHFSLWHHFQLFFHFFLAVSFSTLFQFSLRYPFRIFFNSSGGIIFESFVTSPGGIIFKSVLIYSTLFMSENPDCVCVEIERIDSSFRINCNVGCQYRILKFFRRRNKSVKVTEWLMDFNTYNMLFTGHK